MHYHLSVVDHIEVFAKDPQWNDPRSEYGPGTDVVQYEQGTFVLHFVEAETNEDLWFAWAQGGIGPALTNSEKNARVGRQGRRVDTGGLSAPGELRPDPPIQRHPGDPLDGHDERGGAQTHGLQWIATPPKLLPLGV